MPFYLGLPIAVMLWVCVLILLIISLDCANKLKNNVTSYNSQIKRIVKEEIEKYQINKDSQNAD